MILTSIYNTTGTCYVTSNLQLSLRSPTEWEAGGVGQMRRKDEVAMASLQWWARIQRSKLNFKTTLEPLEMPLILLVKKRNNTSTQRHLEAT